jgi:hypothetical protein
MMADLMSVATLMTVTAQSQNRVRILRVENILDAGAATAWDASLMSSRLPKFADATASSPREIFNVYWDSAIAAPAGTLVTFEYLQEFSPRIRFLFTKYEWPVEGEEKTAFAIDIGGARPAGRVTAWRARVVYRGRLLAETKSGTWR